MSKKFFSLIHGGNIHIAPGTKVIPEETLSKLIDAQEVLKEVEKDAELYKKEVVTEIEKLKAQAQKEGFEQGYSEWMEKISALEDEIKKVRTDMQAIIVPIALKAAKKIVGREIDASEKTVVDIIANSLKGVSQHKKIRIYVNPKEFDTIEENRDQIKRIFENLEALSILPQDDVDPGGCIIETEGGIINAQLENQWMILENAFQKLVSTQPAGVAAEPETAELVTEDNEAKDTE